MNIESVVLSGMRPTGLLHLGHYHGVLKNWIKLQYEHESYFMVADLHALTTNYDNTSTMQDNIYNMVIDWLACGIDPAQATIFVQSKVPAHSELHLLLSMITPLSWLERVPTYKEMIDKLSNKDIDTYGFLGYPLLQSSDVLLYNTKYVPVGEDQLVHIELTREIARRFNYIFGREVGFEKKAYELIAKLGIKKGTIYKKLLVQYQQNGNDDALERAKYLLQDVINLSIAEIDRLFAFLENKSKIILTEPQALITKNAKLVGLDGQKMSKSYGNTIMLRESPDAVRKKIKSMQTDPARIRRTDKGDPNKCPVWQIHQIYNDETTCAWVQNGCTTANIGCIECKLSVVDKIILEQDKFREQAEPFIQDKNLITNILNIGNEKANMKANFNLNKIKEAMNL